MALSCLCCANMSQSVRRKRRRYRKVFVDGCPRVSLQAAFCACVCGCAHRPADSGTSAECLPFPQSFDVTRSCCDNEPCALPQGEHPVVCPGLCQSCGPAPTAPPPPHTLRTQQWKSLSLVLDSVKTSVSLMRHKCFRIYTCDDADLSEVLI